MAAKKKKKMSARRQLRLMNSLLLGALGLIILSVAGFLLFGGRTADPKPAVTPVPVWDPQTPETAPPGSEPTAAPEAPAVPVPTPETTPVPTPEPEPEYFTLSLLGDCTLAADTEKKGWGIGFNNVVGQDYAYPFSNTVSLLSDDYLTLSNLECCFSDRTYYSIEQFVFLSPAAYANILTEGSVEFVTLANNHTRDFGDDAYRDTCAALDAVGVTYAGEDECYLYQREDGVKIGIYCIYDGLTYNALSILYDSSRAGRIADGEAKLAQGIRQLESMGAEFTVCMLHAGREGYYEPTEEQQRLCRHAADCGFDLVYCTHAHRFQPAESYNGSLILYGMGNWSFGGHTNPGNGTDPGAYDTGIVRVSLCRRGSEVAIEDCSLIPCRISTRTDRNDYCPTPYEEGSAEWERAMSMFLGTYEGANYNADYSFLYQ